MRKYKAGTVVKEQVEVRERLSRKSASPHLDPAEERALRMRHGIGLDPNAPLPSKAEGHPEAAQALHEMEARLLHEMRRRAGVDVVEEVEEVEDAEQVEERRPKPVDSRVKSKIVRALRKKS